MSLTRRSPHVSCAIESGPVPSNLARPVDSCHSIRPVQVVGLLEERRRSEEGRIDRQRLASDRATQSGPRRSRRRNRAVFRVKGQWLRLPRSGSGPMRTDSGTVPATSAAVSSVLSMPVSVVMDAHR